MTWREPRRQPMAGIVALRAQFGRRAERIGYALGRALVIAAEGDPDMAIVEDGVVLAIGLGDLVEALRDQVGADAVAGHEGERRLEEIEPSERRELVEHHQELVLAALPGIAFQPLGQPAADLVEDQAHQRLGPRDVRRRNDQVERDRPRRVDQIGDPPVAGRRRRRHRRVAIEPEERHGRRQHAGAFVLGLVQHLARGRGDHGMDLRMIGRAEMVGRHHPAQRVGEGALRIGEEGGDAGERLLFLRIEDMQDGADQQRMAGLLPMAAPFQRPFGIDQDVGDVLDVADLVRSLAHLEQRVVAGRARIGRIEQQAVREFRPPAGGQLPVLALDVVNDGRPGPRQQRRDDKPDALARAGRREGHDMLGSVMAQILAAEPAEEDAGRPEEPGALDLALVRPARGAIGGDEPVLACPPQRADDGRGARP